MSDKEIISDKDFSTEYSLSTPIFSNENILNKKILDMVKNHNMIGGGFSLDFMSIILLLLGLILIIVGFVLLWIKNDYIETVAMIVNKDCLSTNNNSNDECKINIKYTVENIVYSKIISKSETISESKSKSKSESDNLIKIYYSKSEPNSIILHDLNYSMIGISSIIVGIMIIIFSSYKTNDTNKTNDIN